MGQAPALERANDWFDAVGGEKAVEHSQGLAHQLLCVRVGQRSVQVLREGEVDGIHYNFTTVEQIKLDIEQKKFIEYAEVHGKYYGTRYVLLQNQCNLNHKHQLFTWALYFNEQHCSGRIGAKKWKDMYFRY